MARELAIFAKGKAKKAPSLTVEGIPVRAIDTGYLAGSIIEDGTEFLFTGKIVKRRLPYWLEETKPGALAAYLEKHHPVKAHEPVSHAPASAAGTSFADIAPKVSTQVDISDAVLSGNASDVIV